MSKKDEDNEYPIEEGDNDSIINGLCAIDGLELNNSYEMLKEKGYIQLSNRIGKAMELIESVIADLREKKVDFRIGT
jgi:hypothetical protein